MNLAVLFDDTHEMRHHLQPAVLLDDICSVSPPAGDIQEVCHDELTASFVIAHPVTQ